MTCILLQGGSTALHASKGSTELLATLIRSGADVNAVDKVS